MHIVLQHFAVVTLVILMPFIITSFTLSEHGNAVPGLVRFDALAKMASLTSLKKRILLTRSRNFMNRGLADRSDNGLVSVKRKSIMQAGVRVAVQIQSDGVRDTIRLSRFA
jgi:hypothetical protein